ncbi:MAG TPA: hypothetical protein VE287_01810 [Actinopolymorphaceae bacterium]|nr:hypothetical protein [Actinopolymorphaceae bacterium]
MRDPGNVDPGNVGPGDDGLGPDPLPDSEIPPDPDQLEIPVPDDLLRGGEEPATEEVLEPDLDKVQEVSGALESDALGTDELLPESATWEYEPPLAPSAATRQGVIPEEEGRNETIDERMAQEHVEEEPRDEPFRESG